jgi:hypothetical protein
MLYGSEMAVCSEINKKHINTAWGECSIPERQKLVVHHVISTL